MSPTSPVAPHGAAPDHGVARAGFADDPLLAPTLTSVLVVGALIAMAGPSRAWVPLLLLLPAGLWVARGGRRSGAWADSLGIALLGIVAVVSRAPTLIAVLVVVGVALAASRAADRGAGRSPAASSARPSRC